ncbi:thiamine-phosphate kinase [Luteimonas saliphila]|uniref:thiamine-phosphate kinase n=1 Tax=Luteimonas saliphila TaxID=2804919 RepID=UPI00192DE505|nr:thiamine-phosphate kinase [Luteimonas saliphila]
MEFDLISRIRDRAPRRVDVVLGIGDDAALLQVPSGMQLVVAMDTLNAGVHFPAAAAPADIGWKALAVNLSDLAAMGAQPAWCTLSLSLPEAASAFVDGFLDGFLELAARHDVSLVGGDTTRGPLSICVAVHGLVEPGRALRRAGAGVGDDVWVTGTPGDAAAALAALQAGAAVDRALRARLDRPTPRVAAGRALAGIASACIDVSDGLLADLGHVCAASGTGACIELEALPVSKALTRFRPELRWPWQATGGDDYELCFTAPAAQREAVATALAATGEIGATRIGRIETSTGVRARSPDGTPWTPAMPGYRHF